MDVICSFKWSFIIHSNWFGWRSEHWLWKRYFSDLSLPLPDPDSQGQPMRGYATMNQGPLFDDDPGIMSEVETASTGFRRGGKQRSSLPVVRTPSKTLERPLGMRNIDWFNWECLLLYIWCPGPASGTYKWGAISGLVFLQYRSETKRALLPNEITSIDTVRALFVRSFPRQLTMAYLEGPNVKIYIHDASKDMFYELEDVRSHLREIRDRSVLRLFESNEVAAPHGPLPGGAGVPQPLPQPQHWDQDQVRWTEWVSGWCILWNCPYAQVIYAICNCRRVVILTFTTPNCAIIYR